MTQGGLHEPVWQKSYPPGLRWDFTPPPSTIPSEFDRGVAAHAGSAFLQFEGRTIGFSQFAGLVEAAARGFRALGVGPGVHVALHLPNVPQYLICFHAVQRAGGAVVNLSPLDAERDLSHKLAVGEARLVVSYEGQAGRLPRSQPELRLIMCRPDDLDRPATPIPGDGPVPFACLLDTLRGDVAWPVRSPDELACLQFTGGTTGLPKAAALSQANLTAVNAIFSSWRAAGLPAEPNRIITVLPLFHIYALSAILLPAVVNGDFLILKARWDTDDILDTIARLRPTMLMAVPTMLRALVSHPRARQTDFSCLRGTYSGGAPLPMELLAQFQDLSGCPVLEGWGLTESGSIGTCSPRHKTKVGAAGVPLPGIALEIRDLDDPGRALGPGEPGEVCLKGPNVMTGYHKQPEANAASFRDGWFRTGDVGYLDADGFLFIVDRKKDLIISSGFNVYPRMIEEAIYEFPGVEEVLVIGVPDAYRGESAKALVKLAEGVPEFALGTLRDFLADKVGRHEMPAALEFRPELPKTPVGKLWKKPLIDEARAKAASLASEQRGEAW